MAVIAGAACATRRALFFKKALRRVFGDFALLVLGAGNFDVVGEVRDSRSILAIIAFSARRPLKNHESARCLLRFPMPAVLQTSLCTTLFRASGQSNQSIHARTMIAPNECEYPKHPCRHDDNTSMSPARVNLCWPCCFFISNYL